MNRIFVLTVLILIAAGEKVCSQTQTNAPAQPPKPAAPRWVPEMTEYYTPAVPVVVPGKASPTAIITPPSDAISLFNGKDLSNWAGKGWDVKDGELIVKKRAGDISTVQTFNDFQLHLEWLVPSNITGTGQQRGNSGVFLQGIYEVQILDDYNDINTTYVNGQTGSIYKQTAPLKNATNAPGQWNAYDIIYTAPRFKEDSTVFSPAYVTVILNGVLLQNHTQIRGNTPYIGLPRYRAHGKGPIRLQDHGDPSEPVHFRNIWIREL
ncbi:MAG: DUF1080 domain-containing protein [Chitinophagaceae bacterium]|nr:DUF1080 domain-containing protein [Chitinophagaceae bacterium]